MRKVLLDDILAELVKVEPIELPENVLQHFAKPDLATETPYHMASVPFTDGHHEDRFGYIEVSWGEWQIVLGYGDRNGSTMWDGVWSWSVQKGYDTHPTYFQGEINNGSPDYVVWHLFQQLSEQIEQLGNCDTCNAFYDVSSTFGRCGECGECAEHCTHTKGELNA